MGARPDLSLDERRENFYERVADANLAPLWTFFDDWFKRTPPVRAVPTHWSYQRLRALVLEAGELIGTDEAERRVLALENPGLRGRHLATESLYAGLQLIRPGEVARAHRHSPAALRFILEGSGAYTAVNGEKCYMERGDLILTPSWAWHDHGHEGNGPTVWLDVLDVPLNQMLGTTFSEPYPSERFPERVPPGDGLHRFGMNMAPIDRPAEGSPLFAYPYQRAREVLEQLRENSDWDRHHALKMEYIDPVRGDAAMATISTFLQLVPAGFTTAPYRSTDATVLCVAEGRGAITLDGGEPRRFEYEPSDIVAIPSWHEYSIAASEESVLFSASDRVVQRKLGLWREQKS